METSAPAQSASGRYPRVASSIHLILVLAAIGGWAIAHKIFTDQLSAVNIGIPAARCCGILELPLDSGSSR